MATSRAERDRRRDDHRGLLAVRLRARIALVSSLRLRLRAIEELCGRLEARRET